MSLTRFGLVLATSLFVAYAGCGDSGDGGGSGGSTAGTSGGGSGGAAGGSAGATAGSGGAAGGSAGATAGSGGAAGGSAGAIAGSGGTGGSGGVAGAGGGGAGGSLLGGSGGGGAGGASGTDWVVCNDPKPGVPTSDFCDYYDMKCSTYYGQSGNYASKAACMTSYDAASNTAKGCRAYHLCQAGKAQANVHCPHAAGNAPCQ